MAQSTKKKQFKTLTTLNERFFIMTLLTNDFLKKHGFDANEIQIFNNICADGEESLNVLHKLADWPDWENFESLKYEEVILRAKHLDFAQSLVSVLPFEDTPLVQDNVLNENLIWLGDAHVKGNIYTDKIIFVKGQLKVDGKINVYGRGQIYTCGKNLIADAIYLRHRAHICTDHNKNTKIQSDTLSMMENAIIDTNINSNIIHIINGNINGDITAKEIKAISGRLVGNISANSLGNYRAYLNGKINVDYIYPLTEDCLESVKIWLE